MDAVEVVVELVVVCLVVVAVVAVPLVVEVPLVVAELPCLVEEVVEAVDAKLAPLICK